MKRLLIVLTILALATLGCGLSTARVTPTSIFSVTVAPTLDLGAATRAAIPPSQVTPVQAPAQPTVTPIQPTPRPPEQPPAEQNGQMTLKIFMIAINDNGASGKIIGCNDSVVPVYIQVPQTQGVLRAALNKLLSLKERDYGQSGLVNALYQSNLAIDSLVIQNGEAIMRLSGQLVSGGTCDDPRIIAQLEETALQFSTVDRVTIYVNDRLIQDALSGRG